MSTHSEPATVEAPSSPVDKVAAELGTMIPNLLPAAGRALATQAIAVYEEARRPEWSEVMIATVEQERDDARGERDRARATAVRFEQALAETRR